MKKQLLIFALLLVSGMGAMDNTQQEPDSDMQQWVMDIMNSDMPGTEKEEMKEQEAEEGTQKILWSPDSEVIGKTINEVKQNK